jgi:hypothetical protein
MIFNLIIDRDDDGNSASRRRPAAPAPNPMKSAESPTSAAPASSRETPHPPPESDAGNLSSDELMAYDNQLEKAAQRGMLALREAWYEIPASIRPHLNAALERRHKPAAAQAGRALA